jgi:hypothetical protein
VSRSRSRFDHLAAEVSVAVGVAIPRYPLWLRLHELGSDPEDLSREDAVDFCAGPLIQFLMDRGYWISPRARRRLVRTMERFDPSVPSPAERFPFQTSHD